MRVLVACEESQAVAIAFRQLGHEAYSADLQPCSGGHPEWHFQCDVCAVIESKKWDIMIAHPPCTYLSNAGVKYFNERVYGDKAVERKHKRDEALEFVKRIASADIPRIAIENPVGWLNSHWRMPEQIIQPYYFGDPESKRTCLWLKNLPRLRPTKLVKPKVHGYYQSGAKKGKPIYFSDSLGRHRDHGKMRSKTFPGIARAMADQWGNLKTEQLQIWSGRDEND